MRTYRSKLHHFVMRCVIFLTCFVYSTLFIEFVDYNLNDVFAQGIEWQRIRTTTLTSEGTSISGEVPSVEYFISVGDSMEIFVWQNADLTRTVTVGPDRKISYPLIGRIEVVGMTIEQLEQEVTKRLSEYIKYPQVSIMMKEFSGDKIIILGEVSYPGIYTYVGRINLIEALAKAGDFTEQAREDSIIIVRGDLKTEVQARRVNLASVLKGKIVEDNDLSLMANDIIYVPKSFIANINKFMQNIAPTLSRTSDVLGIRRDIRQWTDK